MLVFNFLPSDACLRSLHLTRPRLEAERGPAAPVADRFQARCPSIHLLKFWEFLSNWSSRHR